MTLDKKLPQPGVRNQVTPAEIPGIARAGYRLLICNRPDGEEPGQPTFAQIAAAARAEGIEALHLPVSGPADIARHAPAMARALKAASGPVLAYCRSGARATALYTAACES